MKTRKQITKRLIEAGLNEADFKVNSTKSVDILPVYEDEDRDFVDDDATYEKVETATSVLGWGGYRCGWGAWCLSKDYVGHTGDWNDRTSSHHY